MRCSLTLLSHLSCRRADRAEDAHVRAAAAEVAVQGGCNLRVARVLLAPEERDGRDDDAVDAIAALDRLLVDERLLDRMQSSGVGPADPFDGRDVVTGCRPQRRIARRHGIPVEENVARATLAGAAAESRSLELQVVAKNIKKRRVRLGLDLVVAAVNTELERLSHGAIRT